MTWYDPRWHYEHDPETRAALDLIASGHFSGSDRNLFRPILDTLMRGKFSSDRTIAEYAQGIWGVRPCPVS